LFPFLSLDNFPEHSKDLDKNWRKQNRNLNATPLAFGFWAEFINVVWLWMPTAFSYNKSQVLIYREEK